MKKQLEVLIEKSMKSGIKIETVIGDIAYSEKSNIIYTDEHSKQWQFQQSQYFKDKKQGKSKLTYIKWVCRFYSISAYPFYISSIKFD